MTTGFFLRAATTADLPEMARLHHEIFQDEPWNEGAFASVLAMPGAVGRLIGPMAQDPAIWGLLVGLLIGPECEIVTIGVSHDRRHGGLGRALLGDFIAIAKTAGAETLFLEVAQDNETALTLYRKAGFETVGRRPDYYYRVAGPKMAALQLRLKLL